MKLLSAILILFVPSTNGFLPPGTLASKNKHHHQLTNLDVNVDIADTVDTEEHVKNLDVNVVIPNHNHKSNYDMPDSRRAFLTTAATLATTTLLATTSNPPPSNAETTSVAAASVPLTFQQVIDKSAKKAISGGKAGATASVVQVLSLMWLRTSMNYQYRYGGTLQTSLSTLYADGGIPRLYQGLPFALVQGPMTRFGDTAANVGILTLLESIPECASLPLPVKTACGSICAGLWRIVLMPVDTSKTVMQVEGKEGLMNLMDNVRENGATPLYRGAVASAAATAVGHFPWFLTYNFLNDVLPIIQATGDENVILLKLARSAFLGLSASCISDVCSNSLRVIKTTKQTAGLTERPSASTSTSTGSSTSSITKDEGKKEELTYRQAVDIILEKDGLAGLFGRGLQTRLLTNAIQGAVFSVLWRYFQEMST